MSQGLTIPAIPAPELWKALEVPSTGISVSPPSAGLGEAIYVLSARLTADCADIRRTKITLRGVRSRDVTDYEEMAGLELLANPTATTVVELPLGRVRVNINRLGKSTLAVTGRYGHRGDTHLQVTSSLQDTHEVLKERGKVLRMCKNVG